jgi:hypothetical protein
MWYTWPGSCVAGGLSGPAEPHAASEPWAGATGGQCPAGPAVPDSQEEASSSGTDSAFLRDSRVTGVQGW